MLEDTFGTFLVEGGVGGVNKEVVHVDDEPSFSNHFTERLVHEALEGGGRVGESKEHDSGFEQPLMVDKGCLPLMAVFDSHVVVSPTNVKFGEDSGIS